MDEYCRRQLKGKYDNFDLGDDRVGVPLDAKPVFISFRLDRKLLQSVKHMHAGEGTALYRRVLGPDVFIPMRANVARPSVLPRSSRGRIQHTGVEVLLRVLSGQGSAQVKDVTA